MDRSRGARPARRNTGAGFRRPGEAEGVSFWTRLLLSFGTSRSQVVVDFSEGTENQAKVAAAEYLM